MPATGARMMVRSRSSRARSSRARAASTSGLPSTAAPAIIAWLASRWPDAALRDAAAWPARRAPRRAAAGLLEGGAGGAQLLAGDRAGLGQRCAPAIVEPGALVPRRRPTATSAAARLASAPRIADLGGELAVGGHVAGDPAARLVVGGLGLGEREARVGLVEDHQRLAGAHVCASLTSTRATWPVTSGVIEAVSAPT